MNRLALGRRPFAFYISVFLNQKLAQTLVCDEMGRDTLNCTTVTALPETSPLVLWQDAEVRFS